MLEKILQQEKKNKNNNNNNNSYCFYFSSYWRRPKNDLCSKHRVSQELEIGYPQFQLCPIHVPKWLRLWDFGTALKKIDFSDRYICTSFMGHNRDCTSTRQAYLSQSVWDTVGLWNSSEKDRVWGTAFVPSKNPYR